MFQVVHAKEASGSCESPAWTLRPTVTPVPAVHPQLQPPVLPSLLRQTQAGDLLQQDPCEIRTLNSKIKRVFKVEESLEVATPSLS